MEAFLLTNDTNMKTIAEKEGLKVFRVLKIFDLLIQENLINKKEAIEKLNELIKINKRLTYSLCEKK